MMIIIRAYTKCPKCETMYSFTDMISEDTTGAEFWSDGFCMAPMRKDIIKFAKCPACGTFFWLQENVIQKPLDVTEIKDLENSLSMDNISSKEIDFIKAAFRSGLANNIENEINLRIKLWHTINHIIRKSNNQGLFTIIRQKFFENNEHKVALKQYNSVVSLKLNNLIRLANLLKLDKSDNAEYLLLAEIHRELGDFSKAMIFCYKAETTSHVDIDRIMQLKENITLKSKIAYKL